MIHAGVPLCLFFNQINFLFHSLDWSACEVMRENLITLIQKHK